MKTEKTSLISVATNRKAFHNYVILETFEAGLVLHGAETKSLRAKQASLEGSFARVENGQAMLYNAHIAPYAFNHTTAVEPLRTRKLLLKKTEIKRLLGHAEIKGNTLVPLEIYFKNGWAKVKLALAKGKKSPDKRDSIKRKDLEREIQREFKKDFKG